MNKWNEGQFERAARSLDGERLDLSAAERDLAGEVRRLDASLAGAMDTPVPARATARANRRLVGALAAMKMWRHVRVGFLSGVSAAALIVISLGLTNLMVTGSILPDYDLMAVFGRQDVWEVPATDPVIAQLAVELVAFEAACDRTDETDPMPVVIQMPQDEPDDEIHRIWEEWLDAPWDATEGRARTAPGASEA